MIRRPSQLGESNLGNQQLDSGNGGSALFAGTNMIKQRNPNIHHHQHPNTRLPISVNPHLVQPETNQTDQPTGHRFDDSGAQLVDSQEQSMIPDSPISSQMKMLNNNNLKPNVNSRTYQGPYTNHFDNQLMANQLGTELSQQELTSGGDIHTTSSNGPNGPNGGSNTHNSNNNQEINNHPHNEYEQPQLIILKQHPDQQQHITKTEHHQHDDHDQDHSINSQFARGNQLHHGSIDTIGNKNHNSSSIINNNNHNSGIMSNQMASMTSSSQPPPSSTSTTTTSQFPRGPLAGGSLPISMLFSDLLKLARPFQGPNNNNHQSGSNNNGDQQPNSNNRANQQPIGILQQLRSLPSPLLSLLQNLSPNLGANTNAFGPGQSSLVNSLSGPQRGLFINSLNSNDASESNQHYQKISLLPSDISEILARSMRSPSSAESPPLPAFPAPKGFTEKRWSFGESPDAYQSGENANADFVANNVAGFVRFQAEGAGDGTPSPSAAPQATENQPDQQNAVQPSQLSSANNMSPPGNGDPVASDYNQKQMAQQSNSLKQMQMQFPVPVQMQMTGANQQKQMQLMQISNHNMNSQNRNQQNLNQNMAPTYQSHPTQQLYPNSNPNIGFGASNGQQVALGAPIQHQMANNNYNLMPRAVVIGIPTQGLVNSDFNNNNNQQLAMEQSKPASSIVLTQASPMVPNNHQLQPAPKKHLQISRKRKKRSIGAALIDSRLDTDNRIYSGSPELEIVGLPTSSGHYGSIGRSDDDPKLLLVEANDEDSDSPPVSVLMPDGKPTGNAAYKPQHHRPTLESQLNEDRYHERDQLELPGQQLDTASSGLMTKLLLGRATTNHHNADELEDADLDDEDETASEKRKEELEDAEFGIVSSSRKNRDKNKSKKKKYNNSIDHNNGKQQHGSNRISNSKNTYNNKNSNKQDPHQSTRRGSGAKKMANKQLIGAAGLNNNPNSLLNEDPQLASLTRQQNKNHQDRDSSSDDGSSTRKIAGSSGEPGATADAPGDTSSSYASTMRRNQQRSDIEFYGHPGEETRQLKYGILGSGNYEVVNGGVYMENDELTAAVNSVANYVRKPGQANGLGMALALPRLLASEPIRLNGGHHSNQNHHHNQQSQQGGGSSSNREGGHPFMPAGGRLTATSLLRGSGSHSMDAPNHQISEITSSLMDSLDQHHHGTNTNEVDRPSAARSKDEESLISNPLLDLIYRSQQSQVQHENSNDNNSNGLEGSGLLSQLGSSQRSIHTGSHQSEGQPESIRKATNTRKNINKDTTKKQSQSSKSDEKMLDQLEEKGSNHVNHSNSIDLNQKETRNKKNIFTHGEPENDELITHKSIISGNKLKHQNDQFNSYVISPSKKVTIFSDRDLDSAPSEQQILQRHTASNHLLPANIDAGNNHITSSINKETTTTSKAKWITNR